MQPAAYREHEGSNRQTLPSSGDSVLGNRIYGNGSLGISLTGLQQPTANDDNTGDSLVVMVGRSGGWARSGPRRRGAAVGP